MYRADIELVMGLRSRMRDPAGVAQRWSDAEMLDAVNVGIAELHNRVGFYVEAPMTTDADDLFAPPTYLSDQILIYVDGQLVVTSTYPGDDAIDDAIMHGWVYNQRIPADSYTLLTALDASDTSMDVQSSGSEMPPQVGHFTVGLEVIRYNGVAATAASQYTLSNLQRNMNGGGSNAALINTPIYMTIFLDDTRIYDVINNKASAYLHQLYTTDASPTQIQDHQWTMRWNEQQVTNFWRSYVPQKRYVRRPMRKAYS